MRIKANESLFRRFHEIAIDLQCLSSIVQNDQKLDAGDLSDFCEKALALSNQIGELAGDVVATVER